MATTQVCIDCYNRNASVILDDIYHVFSTYDRFVELTGFERNDANIVTYELERNLFAVEYVGGIVMTGNQTPEIQWIEANLESIRQAAITDEQASRLPESPLIHHRNGLLYTTDWVFVRHNEQLLLGIEPSFTVQQLQELSAYRQALRDMPAEVLSSTTYNEADWPVPPTTIA